MTFRTTALMNQTPKIACLPNGPYYLLNDMTAAPVPNLRRANGEPCATARGVALCRCGGSRNKPFCDGTHSLIGFKDQKSANATPNRRESYAGRRIARALHVVPLRRFEEQAVLRWHALADRLPRPAGEITHREKIIGL